MAKVKVNHSGSCSGYTYTANIPFAVRDADFDNLVTALGREVTVVEGKAEKKEPVKEPVKEVAKEAKPEKDKMVRKEQVVTK